MKSTALFVPFLMMNSLSSHAQNDRSSDKLNIVYIMTDDDRII